MKEKQVESCLEILNYLRDNHFDKYQYFQGPAEHALDDNMKAEYRKLIPNPMDMSLVREKLTAGKYSSVASFQDDVVLCLNNCKKFCKSRFPDVARVAEALQKVFKTQMDKYLNSTIPVVVVSKATTNSNSSSSTFPSGAVAASTSISITSSTSSASSSAAANTTTAAALPTPMKLVMKASKASNSINTSPATTAATTAATTSASTAAESAVGAMASSSNDSHHSTTSVIASPTAVLPSFRSKCEAIIKELMKMESAYIFQSPVDLVSYPSYGLVIPNPMDFSTILSKLQVATAVGGSKTSNYTHHNEFALDVRRVIGNFIRYNFTKGEYRLRQSTIKILMRFEKLWHNLEENANNPELIFSKPMPMLTQLIAGIEELYKLEGIENFIHPVRYYFPDEDLQVYLSIVKRPMDIGTIVSGIIEARYGHTDEIIADITLLSTNCKQYWTAVTSNSNSIALSPDAQLYIKQTNSFKVYVVKMIDNAYAAAAAAAAAVTPLKASSAAVSMTTPNSNSTSTVPAKSSTKGVSLTLSVNKSSSKSSAKGDAIPDALTAAASATTTATATTAFNTIDANQTSLVGPIKSVIHCAPATLMHRITSSTNMITSLSASSASVSSTNAIEKRLTSFRKELFKVCLDELKKHFIFSPILNVPIVTSTPFLYAVDPIQYPDYFQIISNPMDITKIEKKLAADKYNTVESIVSDMELIRSNAHLYNVGEQGVEIRIMADQLMNYFKYLLKISLLELVAGHYDDWVASRLITDDVRENVLPQGNSDDVVTYLKAMLRFEGYATFDDRVMYEFGTNARLGGLAVIPSINADAYPSAGNYGSSSHSGSSKKRSKHHHQQQQQQQQAVSLVDYDNSGSDYVYDIDAIVEESARQPKTSSKKSKAAKKKDSQYFDGTGGEYEDEVILFNSTDQQQLQQQLPQQPQLWADGIGIVLTEILKHAYVDPSSAKVFANFFTPLLGSNNMSIDPDSDDPDLEIPPELMHLNILIRQYELGRFTDQPFEFTKRLIRIFQFVVDYVNPDEYEYTRKLYRICAHLARLSWWLCLEYLEVPTGDGVVQIVPALVIKDRATTEKESEKIEKIASEIGTIEAEGTAVEKNATESEAMMDVENASSSNNNSSKDNSNNPEKQRTFEFSFAARTAQRLEREKYLKGYCSSMKCITSLCKRLYKSLLKCKNKNETKQLDYFREPVKIEALSDYTIYVRKPMDLGTIKNNLEEEKYLTCMDFVEDCRRVFSNAIKYNGAHKDTDTFGVSLAIYNAAIALRDKLEELLNKFTIEMVDKVFQQNLIDEELNKTRIQTEMEERQQKEAEMRYLGTLMEQNKRRQKEQERLAKRMRKSGSKLVEEEEEEEDDTAMLLPSGANKGLNSGTGTTSAVTAAETELFQFLPRKFQHLAPKKCAVLAKAWAMWLPYAMIVEVETAEDDFGQEQEQEQHEEQQDSNVDTTQGIIEGTSMEVDEADGQQEGLVKVPELAESTVAEDSVAAEGTVRISTITATDTHDISVETDNNNSNSNSSTLSSSAQESIVASHDNSSSNKIKISLVGRTIKLGTAGKSVVVSSPGDNSNSSSAMEAVEQENQHPIRQNSEDGDSAVVKKVSKAPITAESWVVVDSSAINATAVGSNTHNSDSEQSQIRTGMTASIQFKLRNVHRGSATAIAIPTERATGKMKGSKRSIAAYFKCDGEDSAEGSSDEAAV